jgi:hypothetical protein
MAYGSEDNLCFTGQTSFVSRCKKTGILAKRGSKGVGRYAVPHTYAASAWIMAFAMYWDDTAPVPQVPCTK